MATFKIYLGHLERMEQTGYADVTIRITHNRRLVHIPTGLRVTEKQIRNGEVADPHILAVLNSRIMRFNDYLVDMLAHLPYMSANEVKDAILQREAMENRAKNSDGKGISLFDFWENEFLRTTKTPKTKKLYMTSMKRLRDFCQDRDLYTSQITLRFLLDYERHLVQTGVGPRGINLYMTHLKCVFNRAKDFYNDEDGRLTLIPNNPFSKYRIPAQPPAKKEGDLSKEQLLSIINYRPGTAREELARDCFVMSLFLAGINSADLYHAEVLSKDWVLYYERTKTKTRRSDRARQRITVPEYLRPLFTKYRDNIKVLNFHRRYAGTPEFNAAINKGLKNVGAAVGILGLHYYQARHSFATIARNDLRFPLDDVSKCLGHVPSNPTTDIYIKQDYAIVDEVNRAVLEWVLA